MAESFADRVSGIAALAEPARRALYEYVASQPEPVSREQAAAATGIAGHTVKFHLDRLVEQGLLTAAYRRTSGRSGPGAGRPAKLYRRVAGEISVSLPARHYDLAAEVLAAAVEHAVGGTAGAADAVRREAYAAGRHLAESVLIGVSGAESVPITTDSARGGETQADPLAAASAVLAAYGYEPRTDGDRVVMANCPFHALAQRHPALVCGLNHALLTGLTDALQLTDVTAVLDPAPDRCCVTLAATPQGPQGRRPSGAPPHPRRE